MSIKPIDKTSIHRITSGQVVIDLQTAVKELELIPVEEVRFKQYGLASIEVIDNGGGISEENYEGIALKHHTSKLSSFADLTTVTTFGFRGEALSSLCALCDSVVVSTSTQSPMGVTLEMDSAGKICHKAKRGTTITLLNLFSKLPVRRKEFERNAKREFGKALALLNAYALGPCSSGNGVRLVVEICSNPNARNAVIAGRSVRTLGSESSRQHSRPGPRFLCRTRQIGHEKRTFFRATEVDDTPIQVRVSGLVSKFAPACGRAGTDRQFFYVNGRPCNLPKVQKALNEVYRSFNATQSPFIVADFLLPTDSCDINVSPDKRTIFLHHESNLIAALKSSLESNFAPSRSIYDVEGTQSKLLTQTLLPISQPLRKAASTVPAPPLVLDSVEEARLESPSQHTTTNVSDKAEPLQLPPNVKRNAHRRESPPPPTQIEAQSSRLLATHPFNTARLIALDQPGDSPFLVPESRPRECLDVIKDPTPARSTPTTSIAIPSSPVQDVVVRLDSSPPSWQRKLKLARKASDEPGSTPVPVDEGSARKKRRSDISTDAMELEPPKPTQSARQNLRSFLAGFSRPGSQLGSNAAIEEDELQSADEGDTEEVRFPTHVEASGDEQDRPMLVDSDLDEAAPSSPEPQPTDTEMQIDSNSSDADGHDLQEKVDKLPDEEPDIVVIDTKSPPKSVADSSVIDLTDDDPLDSSVLSTFAPDAVSATPSLEDAVARPEVIRTSDSNGDVSLRFNLTRISRAWENLKNAVGAASDPSESESSASKILLAAGLGDGTNDDTAAQALSRTISKEDFGSMNILGQFNLGFIIARRRKSEDGNGMDDLFIVDQHAADEKYNFETLQQITRIKSQKLFRPQVLELTAGDELLALENIEVLRQNGFEVEAAGMVSDDSDSGPGSRLSLTAQPVSKDTVFDMKDLEEIIHRMRDQPVGQMVRCSKARAMFAMRACRKSVMIGMPLSKPQMTAVVRHMGTMDQPWNCPHGRPTMRHLADIVSKKQERRATQWAGLGQQVYVYDLALGNTSYMLSIAPILRIQSGETVNFDCLDASNGQITPDSTVESISSLVFSQLDQVNGPIYVEGAVPGDTLQVDVLSVVPAKWGWTACIPGFGLLSDEYTEPALKIWELNTDEMVTYFDEEKKIRIPLRPFAGEMGVAPGKMGAFSTIPPYATGGNIDTKHLSAGATLYLPVEVEGALFSIGDGHAVQGDGVCGTLVFLISDTLRNARLICLRLLGTAIETPMNVSVRLTVRKDRPYTKTPHFKTPKVNLTDEEFYCTTGVDADMREATRAAVRNMIEFLVTDHGFNRIDAYMLCSVAADLRLHEVVDMPNYVVGMMIPRSILPGVNSSCCFSNLSSC
ncbi:DNA mismatch repair protein MutL [Favolaschia claudopus]|uniref:DNA mismatch repair protein MutL n=1 Tax=Favolaschia claudopus TaxID=2862362 RepID=A0AAW0A874_9AGAR